MDQQEKKYPTLGQLTMERKQRKWEIEADIRELEKKFKSTSRILNPDGWLEIQDQLGAAYRRLMAGNHEGRFTVASRATNKYFMHKE